MSRILDKKALAAAAGYIDGWLAYQRLQRQLPALGVLIRVKGKAILHRAYGEAAPGEKLTVEHRFAIASNTKMFTAAAILQLWEQGRLKLDDKVAKHLPWLKAHADRRWSRVTIQHLLNHASGISRDGAMANFWNGANKVPSREQFKADVLAQPLYFMPGRVMKYSNYGYGVLGLIVEAVSGTDYKSYVRQHILDRLSLAQTQFDDELPAMRVQGRGKLQAGKRIVAPVLQMQALAPAGGLWSSLDDLACFGEELVWGKKLLSPASRKLMRQARIATGQKARPYYGLGFEQLLCGKTLTMGHGGGALGFTSRSLFDAVRQLSVVLYVNANSEGIIGLMQGIVGAVDFFQKHGAPRPSLAQYSGRFENLWGVDDIIPAGDGLYAACPDNSMPLGQASKLRHDSGLYYIGGENPFVSIGQPLEFTFKRGKLAEIGWGGSRQQRVETED